MYRRLFLTNLAFCALALGSSLQPQSRTVNLRQWGYALPANFRHISQEERAGSSRLLAFYENGSVVAGFVTREADTLATRDHPALTLHVITFSKGGSFLSELKFPTSMWNGNGIFVSSSGDLLVRTPDALTLYSEAGKILTKRPLDRRVSLRVFSNRQEAVLEQEHDIQVISLRTLATVKRCSYPYWFGWFSNHNVMFLLPRDPADLQRPFGLRVDEICGPTQFTYRWRLLPGAGLATLLDDTRFITIGLRAIEVVDRDAPQWRDSFGKYRCPLEAQTDQEARTFAIVLAESVGGSRILDINSRLKSVKIVVYRTTDGKRLAEVPVEHLGKPAFSPYLFHFALSPDGSLLAVLSDGFLQITPISGE